MLSTKPAAAAFPETAYRQTALSQQNAFAAHQRGPRSRATLSRGHRARGVVRVNHVVKAEAVTSALVFDAVTSLKTTGQTIAPFFSLVRCAGANRLRHGALPSPPILQCLRGLGQFHFNVLSSSLSLVRFDANGKELTCRTSILCSWSKNL